MTRYLLIFTCLFLTFFTTCKPTSELSNHLADNETFSINETKQLIELLHTFDKSITKVENLESSNLAKVYMSFFERLNSQYKDSEPIINIGIDRENHISIESIVDDSLAQEIWQDWDRLSSVKERNIEGNLYGLNQKGKYFKYLENEVAPEISVIQKQLDFIYAAGDTSPSGFADLLLNHKEYDIRDDRIRLFVSIHYLSHNRRFLDRRLKN